MLVTLTSSSSGKIILFSDVARRLFRIAGKECTAQGVFTKEQLPDSIASLNQAVAAEKATLRPIDEQSENKGDQEIQKQPGISLAQRAQPIIALMKQTKKENGFLTWQAANDF